MCICLVDVRDNNDDREDELGDGFNDEVTNGGEDDDTGSQDHARRCVLNVLKYAGRCGGVHDDSMVILTTAMTMTTAMMVFSVRVPESSTCGKLNMRNVFDVGFCAG